MSPWGGNEHFNSYVFYQNQFMTNKLVWYDSEGLS